MSAVTPESIIAVGCCLTVLLSLLSLSVALRRSGRAAEPPLSWAAIRLVLMGLCLFYFIRLGYLIVPDRVPELLATKIMALDGIAISGALCFAFHIAARAPACVSAREWFRHAGGEPRLDLAVIFGVLATAAMAILLTPARITGTLFTAHFPPALQALLTAALVVFLGWIVWIGRLVAQQFILSPQSRTFLRAVVVYAGLWTTNEMIFTVYLAEQWGQLGDAHLITDAFLFASMALLYQAAQRPTRLAEAMDRFGAEYLMASMPEAMVAVDSEGVIRAINRAAEAMLGHPASSAMGEVGGGPLDPTRWRLGRTEPDAPPVVDEEHIISYTDGRGARRHFASRISKLVDSRGDTAGHVEILHDVTAHKEAELQLAEYSQALEDLVADRSRALEESETRYRGVVDHLGDSLLIVQDGRVRYANNAAIALLSQDGLLLTDLNVSEIWDTGISAPWAEIQVQLAERPDEPWRGDMDWRVADEGQRDIYVTATVARWDGEPAILLVGRDMTDRRRLESSLDRMNRGAATWTGASRTRGSATFTSRPPWPGGTASPRSCSWAGT